MMRPMQVRLVGRFRFEARLEGEHESLLYRAVHTQTGERLVLKGEEAKNVKARRGALSLLQEGKVYQSMQGGIGIPYMHWCGQEEDFNFIVLEELDSPLSARVAGCGGRLSVKSAMMAGLELVTVLQYFHFKYFVYNNLHPRHTLLGRGEKYGQFLLVDFSRATRYRDALTSDHLPQPHDKIPEMRTHNIEFSSINYHKGLVASRRDDMESLLYLLLFLLRGELPWTAEARNLKRTDFERSRAVLDLKLASVDSLFADYPELRPLYAYVLGVKFEEKPQYSYFSSVFSQALERRGLLEDRIYDWMLLDQEGPLELTQRFELFANEEEFLKKVGGELGSVTNEKLAKSIKISDKAARKTKDGKDCTIY